MAIGLTLGGFFIGLIIMTGSGELFGALGGAAIGFLVARLVKLERHARDLRSDLEWLRRNATFEEPDETEAEREPETPSDLSLETTAEEPTTAGAPGGTPTLGSGFEDYEPEREDAAPAGERLR